MYVLLVVACVCELLVGVCVYELLVHAQMCVYVYILMCVHDLLVGASASERACVCAMLVCV